jgi:Ca2+-binding RTX toxin-like protein
MTNILGTPFDDTFIGSIGDHTIDGQAGFDTIDYSRLRTPPIFIEPIEPIRPFPPFDLIEPILPVEGLETLDIVKGADIASLRRPSLAQSITLLPTGTILKGRSGTDQLIRVERIIANASATNNNIDASSAGTGISIQADLSASSLKVLGIPGLPSPLQFTVQNFDNVFGTQGDDSLKGDNQNNQLLGNAGNDTFFGTGGNDTLNGGEGTDTANYQNLGQSITVLPTGIVQKSGGLGTDDTISIETIIANPSVANNTIDSRTTAAGASISVDLLRGNLSVLGLGFPLNRTFVNFDDVLGSNQNDTIQGDNQNNRLEGNSGNDSLAGLAGSDTILGGAGADTITGGGGADTLTGGTGNDIFVYNSPAEGSDTITDFSNSFGFVLAEETDLLIDSPIFRRPFPKPTLPSNWDSFHLSSGGFTGLGLGTLSLSKYGEGNSLFQAAQAALLNNGGLSGAAILGVSSGSNVQVWYDTNTALGGTETLLATLTGRNLSIISQTNFVIV